MGPFPGLTYDNVNMMIDSRSKRTSQHKPAYAGNTSKEMWPCPH